MAESSDEAFQYGRKRNHLRAEIQRRRQGMRRRMRGFAYIAGFSRRRNWVGQKMARIKDALSLIAIMELKDRLANTEGGTGS